MKEAPPNSTHPTTRTEWRAWLEDNHTRDEGVWLISYKKATGKPFVTYDEAVEEAICFGWVDSKVNRLDEERAMRWFAPRRPGSSWSRSNKERVAKMLATGQMTAAGLDKIEARLERSMDQLEALHA